MLHPATKLPPREPDLRLSTLPNLPSHSDTLKSNLERTIAAIGPSAVRGSREMGRIMSWEPQERVRTGLFCAAYFTCWIFGYTAAGVLSFFIAIVCFPDCRRWFFPAVSWTAYLDAWLILRSPHLPSLHLPLLIPPIKRVTRVYWALPTLRPYIEAKQSKPRSRRLKRPASYRRTRLGYFL